MCPHSCIYKQHISVVYKLSEKNTQSLEAMMLEVISGRNWGWIESKFSVNTYSIFKNNKCDIS